MSILNMVLVIVNVLLSMLWVLSSEYSKACYFLLVAVFIMVAAK